MIIQSSVENSLILKKNNKMTEETRQKILEEAERQDAEYRKFHDWEQGTKIMINSFYGGLANPYMYFFNTNLAECITKQGKSAILYAERNINKYFKEHWHRDKKTHEKMGITVTKKVLNDVTVYIDTDSVYSQFKEIISTTDWGMDSEHKNWRIKYKRPGDKDYRYRDFCGAKPREYVVEYFDLNNGEKYEEYEILQIDGTPKDFALLLDEVFLNGFFTHIFDVYAKKRNADNYLNFELESYADSGIWLSKKKYMQNIRWVDKIPRHEIYESLSHIKSKGVELIQASCPAYARKLLNKLVRWIFAHDRFVMADFMNEVKNAKREFMVADIEEICWNKRPNNYQQYVVSDVDELVFGPKTPITIQGLGHFNFLLNSKPKYKSKYNNLKDGMICKYYYSKSKLCEMFAFEPGMYPIEFAPEPDRDTMFSKVVLEPLNRIMNAIGEPEVNNDMMFHSKLF